MAPYCSVALMLVMQGELMLTLARKNNAYKITANASTLPTCHQVVPFCRVALMLVMQGEPMLTLV